MLATFGRKPPAGGGSADRVILYQVRVRRNPTTVAVWLEAVGPPPFVVYPPNVLVGSLAFGQVNGWVVNTIEQFVVANMNIHSLLA